MYQPRERVTTTVKHEFVVKPENGYPITIRDLMDSISIAMAHLKEAKGDHAASQDDALLVAPGDDGAVVLYFEEEVKPLKITPPTHGSTLPWQQGTTPREGPRTRYDKPTDMREDHP